LQYTEILKLFLVILKLENQSENEYIILKSAAEGQLRTHPRKDREKMRDNTE